jgi:2-hydroxychromene-2-carboxylate isomerase
MGRSWNIVFAPGRPPASTTRATASLCYQPYVSRADNSSAASSVKATLYTDPGCPWAYSAIPALQVLDWRYGAQIDWRLVVIGLSDDASVYAARGYTPLRGALGQLRFRRFGMPFAPQPKERISATGRACRAIVSARLFDPTSEWRVLRALQLANFTTPLLLDDDRQLAEVLGGVSGIDAAEIVARLDSPEVSAAYDDDRAEARRAAGSPAELQGKTATNDGVVRFTAPSVVFERGSQVLVAGGFQPVEAYDVLVANLDPALRRQLPPDTPLPLLEAFEDGLTTHEVALAMTEDNDAPDDGAAEEALLELTANGTVTREPLGDGALWQLARTARSPI